MKNKFKGQAGLSSVDITISIGIIVIFVAIITVAYTNLTKTNTQIGRMQSATNYAIAILEKADELYYNEVTQENFETNEIGSTGKHQVAGVNIQRGYDVTVTITESESNTSKNINVNVQYKVGNNTQTVEMQKNKEKEALKLPNKPTLTSLMPVRFNKFKSNTADVISYTNKIPSIDENEQLTPVKYVKYTTTSDNAETDLYVKSVRYELTQTTEDDKDWYDYANKKYALAIKGSDKTKVYAWIPKFAYKLSGDSIQSIKFVILKL